ncbi:MAG TPA: hypothetical protein VMF61_10645 [Candidatus Acidoferrales bacterium]|nr:hypothetical protein [Candidatus Acidoferrales bacterium]
MMRARAAVVAIALAGGCSSQTLPVAAPGSIAATAPTVPSATGTAPFTFVTTVPPSAQSIAIRIGTRVLLDANVGTSSPRCSNAGAGSRQCTLRVAVPAGKRALEFRAFDQPKSGGNLLAFAGAYADAVAGTPQTLRVALIGKIASIGLSFAVAFPAAGKATTTRLSIEARNADGDRIAGDYATPIALRDGDRSGATKLSATTVTRSSAEVTLAYDGAPLSSALVSASARNSAPATARFAPAPETVAAVVIPQLFTHHAPLPVGIFDLCIGPDGNVWGTGAYSGTIEKIDSSGKVTMYPLLQTEPAGISVGSDGNLWFGERQAGVIGRITTGGVVATFAIPGPKGTSPQPTWTSAGSDGRTWFVDQGLGVAGVGAITHSGKVSLYALPAGTMPNEIVAGPDRNMWITDRGLNAIVVMSTAGKVLAVHRLPIAGAEPWGIAVGPDKNLWFTEFQANRIARMTPSGTLREFSVPTASAGPLNLTAGPDGNVWFVEGGANDTWATAGKIGYVTTDGSTIRDFPTTPPANLHGLVFDARGLLWYSKMEFPNGELDEFVY